LYKLDLYIFEEVYKEVMIRHENELPLTPMSVNFSRQDFDHADIVGEMNRLFDKYELSDFIDKSYFIVEITEQDMAVGEERFMEQLRLLRDNGYRIWLDDFGSGYSSLNSLQDFRFDVIKVDMKFMRTLESNPQTKIIVKSIIEMTKNLKLRSLMEGVETQYQYDFIKEIGIDMAQGFLFSRPVPLEELNFN
jgi:EAL domain-containing protein (putative c-di-GMP-specific phosphodiesterase class I)